MGYMHIENLYKNGEILMFRRCYAMEKIHGTSAHISWNGEKVGFFSGGASYPEFVSLFNVDMLESLFRQRMGEKKVIIYGEAYGGKMQGMSDTYGKKLKFIAFDVKIDDMWLDVPKAESFALDMGIEFVHYAEVSTDIEALNAQRDADSIQAVRNGCGEGKMREGIVLRPLIELTKNNGERIIVKHKRDEFRETASKREIAPDKLEKLADARAIADEWVTDMRLTHVLNNEAPVVERIKDYIDAMTEDVLREADGEIEVSPEVRKEIGRATAVMVKRRIQRSLTQPNEVEE